MPHASLKFLLVKVEPGYTDQHTGLMWVLQRGKLTFLLLAPPLLDSNTRLPDPTG